MALLLSVASLSLAGSESPQERTGASPTHFRKGPDFGVVLPDPPRWTEFGGAYWQYIVEFGDSAGLPRYTVLDSIVSAFPPVLSGHNSVAYIYPEDTCYTLVDVSLDSPRKHDSVTTLCGFGKDQSKLLDFDFAAARSILVANVADLFEGRERQRCFVLKIEHDGRQDTIATIDGASAPGFTHDGSEILMRVVDTIRGGVPTFGILIFDLDTRESYAPFRSNTDVFLPQRCSRQSPLYFIMSDTTGGSNLWRLPRGGELHSVTDYSPPTYVIDYYFMDDSIRVTLHDRSGSGSYSEEAIAIDACE